MTHCTCREEHLTAEGMEAQILARFPDRKPCQQAKDFAELALAHYNEKNKTVSKQLIIFLPSQFLLLFFRQSQYLLMNLLWCSII